MERLTHQKWSDDIRSSEEYGYNHIYQRLYDIENKLDSGKIVELPCKVGDTVYEPNKRGFISTHHITSIIITRGSINYKSEVISGVYINTSEFNADTIGKFIFLTQEEAEKALEKMSENNVVFKPYLRGEWSNSHYGYIGEKTPFTALGSRTLFVGDTVSVYRSGLYIGERVVAKDKEGSFIMGLKDTDFSNGSETAGSCFFITKHTSHQDIENGQVIDSIKYIKEDNKC